MDNDELAKYEEALHRVGYGLIAVGGLFVFVACWLTLIVLAIVL